MKICAIICEYNPFHNGHQWHLNAAKQTTNADALVCLMSGNFVQRGEAAIMDKFLRAQHALQAGADVVLELPTIFATSNAELFAKGAVHILSSIPALSCLCFGAENANKTAFKLAAKYLNNEPKEVSEKIKQSIAQGESYAKARANAFAGFIPLDVLTNPNNILGLEYTRAVEWANANIDIYPIERHGAMYSDEDLKENFSSATAIRQAISCGKNVAQNVPDFVLQHLPQKFENTLETLEKYAILTADEQYLSGICDCTEGLENAFKRVAKNNLPLVPSLTCARYTSSRIRRIALHALLNVQETLIRKSLQSPLYLRILAAKKERNDVLSALSESEFPLLVRPRNQEKLSGIARECFDKDLLSEYVYSLLYPTQKPKTVLQ